MFNLHQRSSIASSILTALIGWLGTIVITTLFLQLPVCATRIIPIAIFCTAMHLLFLLALLQGFRKHKSVILGALLGTIGGIGLYFILVSNWVMGAQNLWYWFFAYTIAGGAVGGFIFYFKIDDEQIQLAQSFRKQVNYGRDALWLVPFAYGAVAYLLAFLPSLSLNVLLPATVVGAMVGVAAAGISHYTNDEWKYSTPALLLLITLPGTAIGLVSGFLFGQFSGVLPASPFVFSTVGSLLTFTVTLLKGRRLARKEMEDTL
jgi:hypothetical protein